MSVIVKVIGAADGSPTPHDGRYVQTWNPHTKAGVLALTSTDDAALARRFELRVALDEWHAVSRVQPLRPWDGEPNCPLTAITCELTAVR